MNGLRELVIVGTGGLSKEAAQLARRMDPGAQRWHQVSYAAESVEQLGSQMPYGVVRYVDEQLLARAEPTDVVIAIGHPRVRRAVAASLTRNPVLEFPNLTHPSVEVDWGHVRIGKGNMLTNGVILTCDIEIGDFNLIGWNVTIGHDAVVGAFNVLNPSCNVSGNVRIGDACLLGTGCQILERLQIASGVTIAAGAVLTKSATAENATFVGIPAKEVVRHN
jgi:sugar O-acyltransferase (sialic acid O-acetyltransferase NeuD family)